MSCPRILEAVSDETSAEFETHLKTCADCREARAAYQAMQPGEPSSVGLDGVKAAALRELAERPRVRAWWVDAAAVVALNVVVGVGLTVALKWTTVQHASDAIRWSVEALWLAVLAGGALLAVMPRAKSGRAALIGLAGLGVIASVFGLSGVDPGAPFVRGGIPCAWLELLVAIAPLGLSLFLLTRFAFDPMRAIAAGLSAGAAGLLALHLHCANGTAAHQLGFHFVPMLVIAAIAFGVRRGLRSHSYAP